MSKVLHEKSTVLSIGQKVLAHQMAAKIQRSLQGNYQQGFGISPCSHPNDNFFDQVWSRDGAHGISNWYAEMYPEATYESLETTLRHQRDDGQLPLRVERVYAPLRLIPVIGVWLSKYLFNLLVKNKNGRKERGIYKGQDISGGEDTVPAIIIAVGELFLNSRKHGHNFLEQHYEKLLKAVTHFRTKIPDKDGLAKLDKNPDWTETIQRDGKLGTINILWARALRLMVTMSKQLGHHEKAHQFKEELKVLEKSILEKLYNKEDAYFRTAIEEDRIDTVASIFGSLYFLSPEEAVRVQETLTFRVKRNSGLVNFDPPYPQEKIHGFVRVFGNGHYHNDNVWPWVTCQNIQVKIRIAREHPDEKTRQRYKKEAVEDLYDISTLFEELGGAYEVIQQDKPVPATGRITLFGIISVTTYSPPKNIMASMVAYQGAYHQLEKLGWI